MGHIGKLRGIDSKEARKFVKRGIESVDSLWSLIGTDFYNGIEHVAEDTQISEERLMKLLVPQAEYDEELTKGCWLKRHWFDVAVLLGLCVFALFVWNVAKGFISETTPAVVGNIVSCRIELLPYHIIGPDDITIKQEPAQPETFEMTEDVIGRYPLDVIKPGQPLKNNQLSKVRLSESALRGRYLISLPVKAGAVSPTVGQGSHISLLLSMRPSDNRPSSDSLVLQDAIVLSLEPKGDAIIAVVAIAAEEARKVVPMIPRSDAFLMKLLP